MKNAHFKTCNNLIFANIHRWYKIHTTKKVNEVALRHGTKLHSGAQGFSCPRKAESRVQGARGATRPKQ